MTHAKILRLFYVQLISMSHENRRDTWLLKLGWLTDKLAMIG